MHRGPELQRKGMLLSQAFEAKHQVMELSANKNNIY